MPAIPQDPKQLIDGFSFLDGGVDTGKVPSILSPNQLSFAVNCSLRGGFLQPRPGIKRIDLTFPNSVVGTRFKSGRWQVAGYYKPDIGPECLLVSIGGRQFRINVATDNSVQEITISNSTTTTADFVPPAIGAQVVVSVVDVTGIGVGSTILINGNNYTVDSIALLDLTVTNVDDAGTVNPILTGSAVVFYDPNPSIIEQAWETQAEKWWVLNDGQSIPFIYDGASSRRANSNLTGANKEIGPGRMITYGMGRIWYAGIDYFSFRAADLVGGSSGTPGENYRDSVLKETENVFLNGGGALGVRNFGSPVPSAPIVGLRFVATLDSSLGQGPLQVLTPNATFSVNSPLDRTVWAAMENPIQTISLISYGALSHYGSILVNGDLLYRAVDGIRSLILARREFSTWGNVPISREMNRILNLDDQNLLKFSSAVVFNNRLLITASQLRTSHGIVHRGWITLDFDLLSSMGQKAPPVYDGIGIGLNVLQFVKGEFNKVERCFAFSLNAEQEIELYEFTRDDKFDHQTEYGLDIPISWIWETARFRFGSSLFPEKRVLKRLTNLVMEIDDLVGDVHFKAYFKPDNHPCWVFWKEWDDCAKYKDCGIDPITGCLNTKNFKPQFRPRVSLGQPPETCDPITNRPYRDGYEFQVRFEISGYCKIKSLYVFAEERQEQLFGSIVGC